MADNKKKNTAENQAKLLETLRRDRAERETSYRGRALNLFPHVCAGCGREFEGKRLKELTVHHKDHNHDNNPPDGTNWELLCIYCHDHEHEKTLIGKYYTDSRPVETHVSKPVFQPFAGLDALLGLKTDAAQADKDQERG